MAGLGAILADQDAAPANQTAILADWDASESHSGRLGCLLVSQIAILASQNGNLDDQKAILADRDASLTRYWGEAKLETYFCKNKGRVWSYRGLDTIF